MCISIIFNIKQFIECYIYFRLFQIKPLHPFLKAKITTTVEDINIQNSLANFRACGGRYEKKENICVATKREDIKEISETEQENTKDVLDPINHQKLAVLFCSFSADSNNAPAFCVNPW